MAKERYAALRGEFKRRGILQADIAAKIGRKEAYVCHRMTGKEPWSQEDQYTIMDWLQLPYDQMYYYFPKGGISIDKQERAATGQEQAMIAALRVLLHGSAPMGR